MNVIIKKDEFRSAHGVNPHGLGVWWFETSPYLELYSFVGSYYEAERFVTKQIKITHSQNIPYIIVNVKSYSKFGLPKTEQ